MKNFYILMLFLFSSTVYGSELNVVCKLDKGDGTPIPFRFVTNVNGGSQMYRFGKNETRVIQIENLPPSKSTLVSLEINDSQIRYETKYQGMSHQSWNSDSPLVEEGETRIGTISKIDGSWNEIIMSYGPVSEITGKFKKQYGKCMNRVENKIK